MGDRKYTFWIIIAILVVLSYLIIKPYFIALISSFILAYLVKPVYNRLEKKMSPRGAAGICVAIITFLLIVPVSLILSGLVQQTYQSVRPAALIEIFNTLPKSITQVVDLSTLIGKGTSLILSFVQSALTFLPGFLISLLICLFGIYYILLEWEPLTEKIRSYLPVDNKEKVMKDIAQATNEIVYGTTLVAIIEFVVSAIGFAIVGVDYYLLLPLLIFFSAFIPGVGAGAVWIPAAIVYLFLHQYITAIGVIITGIIVSIGIDTFFRNQILSAKSKIHPMIMLVGVFGGLAIFGIFGFIIGPLVLVYTVELIEQAIKERSS
ncbi:AI-2E family transporter [Candidatus Pacearchaeota archaeon]|nr:AI-2E family transporter [Candidatus Pacearchaeota archaeon]